MPTGGRAVLVLGMHRSGTSAFTRLLSLCGAAGTCARSAAASRRHNEFCGELEALARPAPIEVRVPEEGAGDERPKATGGFWGLEARLYAEYNESVVSGYVGDY